VEPQPITEVADRREMYPLVRLRKLRPDGTAYINWYCYRLPNKAGFVRLFVPARTPRLHVTGSWTPDGVAIVAIDPARSYVVHWWQAEPRAGFYVDAARSIEIRSGLVSYVDLYLDLAYEGDDWRLLDEEELSVLSEEDARLARSAIGDVRQLIASGSPVFDANDDMWAIPDDAWSLEPRRVRRVV